MAKTFREWNVEQAWLLPSPSVLDSVPADHIAHFVRDKVREQLDLTEPAGLSHGERFSQAAPGGAAGTVLQVLKLYQRAGLVTLGNVALDGTKVRGNASKHSDELWADARGLAPFVAQISTSRVGSRGSSPSMPAIVSEGNLAVLTRHHIDAYIATGLRSWRRPRKRAGFDARSSVRSPATESMSNPMSEYRSGKILIRAFVDRKNACYVLVSSQPVDTPDRFALRIGT